MVRGLGESSKGPMFMACFRRCARTFRRCGPWGGSSLFQWMSSVPRSHGTLICQTFSVHWLLYPPVSMTPIVSISSIEMGLFCLILDLNWQNSKSNDCFSLQVLFYHGIMKLTNATLLAFVFLLHS